MKRFSSIFALAALLTITSLPASAGIQGGRAFTSHSANAYQASNQSYALTGQTHKQAKAISYYAKNRSLQGGR